MANYVEKNYAPGWINVANPSRQNLEESNAGAEIRQSTWNAEGGVVPIIYGDQRVGGKIFAVAGTSASGLLTVGVVLCEGVVQEVTELAINDTEVIITSPSSEFATILDANDDIVTGISWEVYNGDQIESSLLLQAAFPGYIDTLQGICYAVVSITSSASAGTQSFPRITARILGKKVYDPRDNSQIYTDTSTWTWSNNPSLCLADLIISSVYGLGRSIDWNSVALCANSNDKKVEAAPVPIPDSPWPDLPCATVEYSPGTTTPISVAIFDKWTRREFVDYYLNLPNVHAKYAMLQLTNYGLYNFMYGIGVSLSDTSDNAISYRDSVWRINCDLWNTRAEWTEVSPLDYSLMGSDPTVYPDGETYFTSGTAISVGQYYYGIGSAGNADSHYFDLYSMSYRYRLQSDGKYYKGYALAGRPVYPYSLPLTLESSRMLDIVIDVEQETINWVETLRGYASCFIVADGNNYTLIPDRPIGFGFNAQGHDWSYVNIPPYAGIDINGQMALEISIKPNILSTGVQSLVSKGYFGEDDFHLDYDHINSRFLFTWTNNDLQIITYTLPVSPLSTTLFTTFSMSLNSTGQIEAYIFDESVLLVTEEHRIVDISRNIDSFTFEINVAVPEERPITIGKAYTGIGGTCIPFLGIVDEFRLWNTVRSLTEISEYSRIPLLKGVDTSLVCHLSFNEGQSTFSKDTVLGWIEADLTYNFGYGVPESALHPTLHTPDTDISVWSQHDGPYDFYKFDGNNMIDGSLKFHRRGVMNIPTVIEFGYTLNLDYNVIEIDGGYGELRPWKEDYIKLDRSNLHGNKVRISRIPMPGITRYSQGLREAQYRYNSVVSDSNVIFSALDDVLNITVGDGIQVHHPAFESNPNTFFKPYRVNSIQQKDAGRWTVSAIEYDPKNYVDINPGDPTYEDTNLLEV